MIRIVGSHEWWLDQAIERVELELRDARIAEGEGRYDHAARTGLLANYLSCLIIKLLTPAYRSFGKRAIGLHPDAFTYRPKFIHDEYVDHNGRYRGGYRGL